MNDSSDEVLRAACDADSPLVQLAAQPFTLWIQGWARLQAESIRFAGNRAAKDLRLPQRIGACASPVEALGVGASFAFEAARDYLGEGQKLFALAAGDFEDAAARVI